MGKTWRVFAMVTRHSGELSSVVGFVVNNLPMEPDMIVRFSNQRGTAEKHVNERRQAINWTRLPRRGMAQNEVRLQLLATALILVVFLRALNYPTRQPIGR